MQSWKAVPFLAYTAMHAILLVKQWTFISEHPGVHYMVTYPLLVISIGGILDNTRFAISALFGLQATFKSLLYICFALHLIFLPSLFLTLSHLINNFLGEKKWLLTMGMIFTVIFTLHGIYEFYHRIIGNLKLTEDMGFVRYTLNRKQASFVLILPVIIISIYGLVMGAVAWYFHGQWHQFALNLISFVGQAQTRSLGPLGPFSSNFLEVVFLASMMSAQLV